MKPNILFIVIDSLRADWIFGKGKKQNTPNIDSIIKKGAYFSNTITTSQYTAQVMQTIFTAKFPIVETTEKKINQEITPLSLLKKFGYNTIATIQKDIFIHGFNQKFDDKDLFDSEENLYNGLQERILKKLHSLNNYYLLLVLISYNH